MLRCVLRSKCRQYLPHAQDASLVLHPEEKDR